jgi:hypothetical protein
VLKDSVYFYTIEKKGKNNDGELQEEDSDEI